MLKLKKEAWNSADLRCQLNVEAAQPDSRLERHPLEKPVKLAGIIICHGAVSSARLKIRIHTPLGCGTRSQPGSI